MSKITKTAVVSVVGRPNVGKSTLTNKLVGQKVAIVSSKPQTTRTRITGVLSRGETQYVLLDTPQIERKERDIRLQLHHLPPYLTGVQLLDGHANAHAHFAQLLHDSRFVYRRCDLGLYRPYMRAEQPAQRRGEYGSAPERRARTQTRRKERQTAFSENMHCLLYTSPSPRD